MPRKIYTLKELEEIKQTRSEEEYNIALNDYSNILPFHTLIKGHAPRNYTEKWYPINIDRYKAALNITETEPYYTHLLNNLTYNIQYLEFLEKETHELEISSTLHRILNKNILVTGVSILEGIFLYLANIHQLGTKRQREFANLIDQLRNHPDILDMDTDIYDTLDEIRDLRNSIHLATRDAESEAVRELDYNNYTDERRKLMEDTLYQILTCTAVSNNPDLFDFLKPSSQQTEA